METDNSRGLRQDFEQGQDVLEFRESRREGEGRGKASEKTALTQKVGCDFEQQNSYFERRGRGFRVRAGHREACLLEAMVGSLGYPAPLKALSSKIPFLFAVAVGFR